MTTKFEADVAAAYKALDERVEIICAVATRLLDAMDRSARVDSAEISRLHAELRQVMK